MNIVKSRISLESPPTAIPGGQDEQLEVTGGLWQLGFCYFLKCKWLFTITVSHVLHFKKYSQEMNFLGIL